MFRNGGEARSAVSRVTSRPVQGTRAGPKGELVYRRFLRFGELPGSDLDQLGRWVARAAPVRPRQTILAEGRQCQTMYLLVSGWAVEFRVLSDGGRQIFHIRLPGEFIGIDCAIYGSALHTVQTLTPCLVSSLGPDDYDEAWRDYSRIAETLFRMTLFERAIAHEWALSLGRRPAWSRVAHLLLELAERSELSGLDGEGVPFPLTQQDVADCTGLTLGYVNRVLADMRSKGLINLKDRSLSIEDAAALARHSGFRSCYLHLFAGNPQLSRGP